MRPIAAWEHVGVVSAAKASRPWPRTYSRPSGPLGGRAAKPPPPQSLKPLSVIWTSINANDHDQALFDGLCRPLRPDARSHNRRRGPTRNGAVNPENRHLKSAIKSGVILRGSRGLRMRQRTTGALKGLTGALSTCWCQAANKQRVPAVQAGRTHEALAATADDRLHWRLWAPVTRTVVGSDQEHFL